MANFKTLKTWIDYNATRYHNLKALPQTLPYIFYEIYLVLAIGNGLPRITINFFKSLNIYIFYKFDSNTRQPVANSCKPYKTEKKMYGNACGNALSYGNA